MAVSYSWAEIFGLALRDSGVAAQGQTPNAQMMADAKMRCQLMLSQWKFRRWLVYHLIDLSTPLTGAVSYSIGPGATIDTQRLDQIDAAYIRQTNQAAQPNQPDFPLRIIKSREDYSRITLKQLSGGPSWAIFFDSGFPTGQLYPWPLSGNGYELHVVVKAPLQDVGNLTDDILYPEEYLEPIYSNTVCRTRAAFRLPPDPTYVAMAKVGLQTLRASNFQIASLQMPTAVRNIRGSGYNIASDSWGPGYR